MASGDVYLDWTIDEPVSSKLKLHKISGAWVILFYVHNIIANIVRKFSFMDIEADVLREKPLCQSILKFTINVLRRWA